MDNPWIGLRPFTSDEREIFYGRQRETQILLSLVASLPTVVVYGASGAGKTSLINAGLVPEIRRDDSLQVVLISDPRVDPLAVVKADLDPSRQLPGDGTTLAQFLRLHWEQRHVRTILIIDQFDERVNACVDNEALFTSIAELQRSASDAACVVVSIREDYLGSLEPLMSRIPGLMNSSYRVPNMSKASLMDAVHGPLRHVDQDAAVEQELIEAVLHDLENVVDPQLGETRYEAGYFQVVWSRLWEESGGGTKRVLRLKTYERLDGVEPILREFTARTLNALEPAESLMFWAMSRYLVLPSGAKLALTVEDLRDLVQKSDYPSPGITSVSWLTLLPRDDVTELIERVFAELTSSSAQMFRRVIRGERIEYELVHDLLGKILLRWRRKHESRLVEKLTEIQEEIQLDIDREDVLLQAGLDRVSQREKEARLKRTVSEAADYAEALERARTPDEDEGLADRAPRMAASFSRAVSDFNVRRSFYLIRGKLDEERLRLAEAAAKRAIHSDSEDARRKIQRYMPFILEPRRSNVATRSDLGVRGRLQAALVGVLLGASSMALAYLVWLSPLRSLDIRYALLTLTLAAVPVVLVYFGLVAAARSESWREMTMDAVLPGRGDLEGLGKWAARTWATWPIPSVLVVGAGIGVAKIFDLTGFATTAGFNVGVLFGGLTLGTAAIVVADL